MEQLVLVVGGDSDDGQLSIFLLSYKHDGAIEAKEERCRPEVPGKKAQIALKPQENSQGCS